MDLFEWRDGIVVPSLHALLMSPFREIWHNDRTIDKYETLRKFRYVELLCSPKKSNVFYSYPEDIRPEKVKKEVFNDENHPIDSDIVNMTIKYKECLAECSGYYQDLVVAEVTLGKLRKFLKGFDPDARTNSGSLVLKPKEIAAALGELPEASDSVEKLRTKVATDLEQAAKTRNSREIGYFERPH